MYEYKINKILKVYDGDTITVDIDLGFGVSKQEKIRFALIDTPEVKGVSRLELLRLRDWFRLRLFQAEELGKDIFVRTTKDKKDKYGRYIGEIFIDKVCINRELGNEGLAIFKEY